MKENEKIRAKSCRFAAQFERIAGTCARADRITQLYSNNLLIY